MGSRPHALDALEARLKARFDGRLYIVADFVCPSVDEEGVAK